MCRIAAFLRPVWKAHPPPRLVQLGVHRLQSLPHGVQVGPGFAHKPAPTLTTTTPPAAPHSGRPSAACRQRDGWVQLVNASGGVDPCLLQPDAWAGDSLDQGPEEVGVLARDDIEKVPPHRIRMRNSRLDDEPARGSSSCDPTLGARSLASDQATGFHPPEMSRQPAPLPPEIVGQPLLTQRPSALLDQSGEHREVRTRQPGHCSDLLRHLTHHHIRGLFPERPSRQLLIRQRSAHRSDPTSRVDM